MRVSLTRQRRSRDADDVWPGESLLYVLRERLGLPGSKNACEQGECGSCTVYLDGAAGLRLPGRRRPGRGPRGASRSRAWPARRPARPGAAGVRRGRRRPVWILHARPDRAVARPARPRSRRRSTPEIREALAGNLCRCTGYEKIIDAVRLAAERRRRRMTVVIEDCAVATVDAAGTEHTAGTSSIDGDTDRRGRRRPRRPAAPSATGIDGTGCLATPGLVNTHHHLYQWATRGLAQDETLFGWLTALYPVWARIDAEIVRRRRGRRPGLAGAVRLHHQQRPPLRLPARTAATCSPPRSRRPRRIGLRFHPCRGSMDLGARPAGCRRTSVVEDRTRSWPRPRTRSTRFHDPAPGSMLRIAVAPCSPFSVSRELMREAADAGPAAGVRLHTHLAETDRRGGVLPAAHGCTPVEYAESLGWLGDDVWLAHGVHLSTRRSHGSPRPAPASRTAPAPTPGSAPASPRSGLLDAGAPVGLGVDGAASQEAGQLAAELRQAMYVARLRRRPGRAHRTATRSLWAPSAAPAASAATTSSARWSPESSPTSRCGGSTASATPASTTRSRRWSSARPPPLELLLVGGRTVVEDGELLTADGARPARARACAGRAQTQEAT